MGKKIISSASVCTGFFVWDILEELILMIILENKNKRIRLNLLKKEIITNLLERNKA